MVEQLEQKERSELHFSSSPFVRLMALYFLVLVSIRAQTGGHRRDDEEGVLDQVLALLDIECVVIGAQVDGAGVTADFTTYGTGTELIWDWSLRFDGELDLAALA